MELLGKYDSTISTYLYNQLLTLFLNNVTEDGDNGGLANVSTSNIVALVNQANTISDLPLPAAGERTNEEQINYPIDLLTAYYNGIQDELNAFTSTSELLLAKLQAESKLLDKLVFQAQLMYWISTFPQVLNATSYSWNFNQSQGLLSNDMPLTDPTTGAVYPQNTSVVQSYDINNGLIQGLIQTPTTIVVESVNLNWTYDSDGVVQTIDGTNSAQLSILEPEPLVTYTPNPSIGVILPTGGSVSGVFSISGDTSLGPVGTYIKTGFNPRQNNDIVTPFNSLPNAEFTTGWTLGAWSQASGLATSGSGTMTSPICTDSSGNPFMVSGAQTIYVEAQVMGNIGAQPLNINIQGLNSEGQVVATVVLPPPTPNGIMYLWSNYIAMPTSVTITNINIVYVATDSNWFVTTPRVHVPVTIGLYEVQPDNVVVYTTTSAGRASFVYDSNSSYVVSENNQITFFGIPDGSSVTLLWTELFPYYQCSVNNATWSPVVMLDPSRPYVDGVTTISYLVKPNGNLFPITDANGNPNGLWIEMVGVPIYQYLFQVSAVPNPGWGELATLEVDMASTGYLNGINISPFVNFPMKLTRIDIEGLNPSSTATVFVGSVEISSETLITFPSQVVSKFYLTFLQEGYSPNDYQVVDSSFIRRQVMQQIQSILPINAQQPPPVAYQEETGYSYELGVQNVYGVSNTYATTSVTVSGPFTVSGSPEVVVYNSQTTGTVNEYLLYKAFDAYGNVLASNTTGIQVSNGVSIVVPYTTGTVRANIASVNFYFKHVLKSINACVTCFNLQVVVQ